MHYVPEQLIPVDQIGEGPFAWTRRHVHPQTVVDALAVRIQQQGLIRSILVRPHEDGHQLVHGSIRLRAARQLGWSHISAHTMLLGGADAVDAAMMDHGWADDEDLTRLEMGWAVLAFQEGGASGERRTLRQAAEVFRRTSGTLSPYRRAGMWLSRDGVASLVVHCARRGYALTDEDLIALPADALKEIATARTPERGRSYFRRAALAIALGRDPAEAIRRKRTPRRVVPVARHSIIPLVDPIIQYLGRGVWVQRLPGGQQRVVAQLPNGEQRLLSLPREHSDPAASRIVVRQANNRPSMWHRFVTLLWLVVGRVTRAGRKE